ncbi:PEBP-like protein [Cucurbitaria berberidis CBS 394.84]|uniref:PEBP-like protein n=1 Tax=Cucurbitaria berberidis CBS 394.84 TaxID=1168544 RepID=A0A9P4GRY6_9PLEO|nr:PEBP-like protein [Cucurbitaria berberidis CBS 394.84]KAF1850194.1 PEBP-like protein [Cucurbitaria berberidis CBS 394.84]
MASNALLDSLRSANLLPSKVIPETFTPTFNLTVKFPSISPEHGSFARVSQVKEQPIISITSTTPDASAQSFTFLLIDPDAPTPDDPKFSYWRHWVVTNIPSPSSLTSDIIQSGRTLTQYLAPGPKDESGPHRYLFLLFKEPGGLKLEKADVGGEEFVDRRSFPAAEFVAKHGLELVGLQWMRGVGDGWKEKKDEL